MINKLQLKDTYRKTYNTLRFRFIFLKPIFIKNIPKK